MLSQNTYCDYLEIVACLLASHICVYIKPYTVWYVYLFNVYLFNLCLFSCLHLLEKLAVDMQLAGVIQFAL